MHGSHAWFAEVAATGRWWKPKFWEHADYVASSPWSAERVKAAFEALMRLFKEEQAKAAFAWVAEPDQAESDRLRNRPHWPLLACPMRADLSGLLRLGLDAADADVFAHAELVRKLREDIPREFKGARFELRCLAAFSNVGVEIEYEPLAGTGKNPDFGLKLDGHQLYIDAKHAEEGEWFKEEQSWFRKLWMPGIHSASTAVPISAHVKLTDEFQRMQDHDDGRIYIRANIDRLAALISPTKERLAYSSGPFPIVEVIESLIEVEVMGPPGPPGTVSGGTALGIPTDVRREVARLVRGAVARGATQIPKNAVGLVLLNPGLQAPTQLLVEEVHRWMIAEGEGAGYPNLLGVLVLSEQLYEPMEGTMGTIDSIVPVWRDGAPAWLRAGPWDALSDAFSRQDFDSLMHRCARASASESNNHAGSGSTQTHKRDAP